MARFANHEKINICLNFIFGFCIQAIHTYIPTYQSVTTVAYVCVRFLLRCVFDFDGCADKKTGQQVTNSYWLAMELRHDRVCNTVNHYLSSLPPPAPPSPPTATATATATRYNLAVLGGDAMKMISERLADSCVSAIFINHPQPPEKILEVKA